MEAKWLTPLQIGHLYIQVTMAANLVTECIQESSKQRVIYSSIHSLLCLCYDSVQVVKQVIQDDE